MASQAAYPPPTTPPAPSFEHVADKLVPAPQPRGLRAAWIASLALLAAAAFGAYAEREGIMHAWPPSQRLYAALGLQ